MSFQMIQEIKCSVTENFSTIEKRLESLEIIAKSPETITSVSVYTSSIRQHASISLFVGDKSQKGMQAYI
jgi:hypothetical protein